MPNDSFDHDGMSNSEQATSGGLSCSSAAPTRRGLLCGLGAAPLFLAAQGAEGAAPTALESWTVILVRHAEKGVDDPRDPHLSNAGKERAAALAALLAGAGVSRCFSTDYRRTKETALPTAEQAGIETEVYDPSEPSALIAELHGSKNGTVALVVGHSNTTPQVLRRLGAPEPSGLEDSKYGRILPDDVYDRLYLVNFVRLAGSAEPRLASSLELRYGR